MTIHHDDMPETTLQDLLEDGRFAEAEALLEMIEQDGEAWAASLRALCLVELGRPDEALDRATRGVGLDPSSPFAHWVLGALQCDRNRLDEASASAEEAIRLDSGDSAHWGLLARVHARRGDWSACLAAANSGLDRHPGDEGCAALRAVALRGTGSDEDWSAEVEKLTRQYPASGWARAGRGWGLLETGRADEARRDFEQALALDPTSDWARHGLIESIKARNPVYSRLLQVFLWIDRLPTGTRWGVILGGLFGYRYLRNWGEANPELAPLTYPVLAAWVFFVLASWTAGPISDFVLARTQIGRGLVRGDDLRAANVIVGLLGITCVCAAVAVATGAERAVFGALAFGFLIIPVAAVFRCEPGWPRRAMAMYASATALAATASVVAPVEAARTAFLAALLMAVVGSWLGVFLSTRVART